MNGYSEAIYFVQWLADQFYNIITGLASFNHFITYFIVFAPIIRMVFRFIHKLFNVGHSS